MLTLGNVIWGARCGETARRVLLGETGSRGHAYSVRRRCESAYDRKAPHGLPSSRLVSTNLLDEWFEEVVKPRLRGEAHEIRFADDAILCFHYREEERLIEAVRKIRFDTSPGRGSWNLGATQRNARRSRKRRNPAPLTSSG